MTCTRCSKWGWIPLFLICNPMITHGGESGQARQPRLTILQTADNVRFGIDGEKGKTPAATLFVFTSTMEAALGDRLFQTAGLLSTASIGTSSEDLIVDPDLERFQRHPYGKYRVKDVAGRKMMELVVFSAMSENSCVSS